VAEDEVAVVVGDEDRDAWVGPRLPGLVANVSVPTAVTRYRTSLAHLAMISSAQSVAQR